MHLGQIDERYNNTFIYCIYELVTVMIHLGENLTSEHFECYTICDNQIMLKQ